MPTAMPATIAIQRARDIVGEPGGRDDLFGSDCARGRFALQALSQQNGPVQVAMPALAPDLVQFHWWDYGDRRYLDALAHLADLRSAGQIHHVGLTNFDTAHVREIVEASIPVVSNQVQFSLIDRRPEQAMAPFCQERGI